ncbi:MAG: DAK2 domain-containing protein [Coriobacteriales bacterium]|nr:DAK2 domain-containing protein [Coriobacteriales bacterium]
MSDSKKIIPAIYAAAQAVSEHQEEINKLNVFPIPDGDTGTNVSLTMENVLKELGKLGDKPTKEEVCKAVRQGSLMGARGNSGVITSQILRGITEKALECDALDPKSVYLCLNNAVDIAYQAVRRPVEGTILTVVKETAIAAKSAYKSKMDLDEMFDFLAHEAMESVKRTPELLPKLKENGVVDSGGLAFAIMLQGFANTMNGKVETNSYRSLFQMQGKVEIEQVNDWEDHNFRYCTEFLMKSDVLDVEETYEYLSSMGDCELVVGEHPDFKIHVHTNAPGEVLTWMIERGQPHEIFIHNMDMQSEDRLEKIAADQAPEKKTGMVAVAVGEGNVAILESLGVDYVVSGGQTMNPSTADIVDAVNSLNVEQVLIFPGNKNIIMAANSAVELANKPCAVIPTTSVPQTFSAVLCAIPDADLDTNVKAMTDAIEYVVTGEVTTAIKDAVGDDGLQIHEGDVMGIIDDSIKVVRDNVFDACLAVIDELAKYDDIDTLTLLAGADLSDEEFERIQEYAEENHPDLVVDPNRGEQPLYPLILAVE